MARALVPATGTPSQAAPAAFEQAEARWRAAEAGFREALAQAEGWRAALLLSNPDPPGGLAPGAGTGVGGGTAGGATGDGGSGGSAGSGGGGSSGGGS